MADFDESEHPRDDDGKFTDGNGSRWTTSKRDYSNVQSKENGLQSNNDFGKINLSQQEWAQYYKIIGDEQHGDFVYHSDVDGDRYVRLENKIVIDNSDFLSPQVKRVIAFASNDLMNDALDLIVRKGVIK